LPGATRANGPKDKPTRIVIDNNNLSFYDNNVLLGVVVSQKPVPPLNSRLCRRVAVLSAASAVGILLVNATLWLVPGWADFAARQMAGLQTEPITLTPTVITIGFVVSTLYLSVLAWGLWVARSLFKRLADGLVFEAETGVLLRRFGTSLVIFSVLSPFVSTLMTRLVTMGNGPGDRLFKFGIESDDIVLIIVGTLVLTIGSVMTEAARLAEDNRQIV
jgi:hypothetical protein